MVHVHTDAATVTKAEAKAQKDSREELSRDANWRKAMKDLRE